MDVLFARQPIFDRELRVFAYELRHGAAGGSEQAERLPAVVRAIVGGELLSGKPGFLPVAAGNADSEALAGLPSDTFIIELECEPTSDAPAAEACVSLQRQGFQVALAVGGHEWEGPLAPRNAFVKINLQSGPPATWERLARQHKAAGFRLLASQVETPAQFAAARELGFDYFEGPFFTQPAAARRLSPFKLAVLRLLAEVQRQDFDIERVEAAILRDLPLCHRLLRYVNSPVFWYRWPIRTVSHALALLGEREVRRWVGLAALPALSTDKPDELVVTSTLRARFCERLALRMGYARRNAETFLMGLFSLLDVLLDRPLPELLDELRIADDIREALLGSAPAYAPLGQICRLVRAYERADWPQARDLARCLGLPLDLVSNDYVESAQWCEAIFAGGEPLRATG